MKSTKKTLIALAITAALGMSGAANAGVLASSTFSITNFLLSNASTGTTLTTANFATLVANNNAGITATLDGASVSRAFDLLITNPATDLLRACVGGGCASAPAENNFTVLAPPAAAQFANADQFLAGTAIVLGAPTTGANARVRSDVSLTGTGTGSSSSNVGLNADFIFSLAQAGLNIGVNFDAVVNLIAAPEAGSNAPSNAQASSALVITLTDSAGNVIFDFGNPNSSTGCQINRTVSRNAPINIPNAYQCSGSFTAQTGSLAAGLYNLSIRQNSNSNARLVSEPGVLSLMGLGLLGIGAALRKRKAA